MGAKNAEDFCSSAECVAYFFHIGHGRQLLFDNVRCSGSTWPGDPDGFAAGILSIDMAGNAFWEFSYANIAPPTAMHIHGPGGIPGANAGVFVNLGVATSGPAGTLIDSKLIHPGLAAAILTNPNEFYVNIHNDDFPGGAVRGQVPEPAGGLLALLGCALLIAKRR